MVLFLLNSVRINCITFFMYQYKNCISPKNHLLQLSDNPANWFIRNIEDDAGISFPSTTGAAVFGASMTGINLANPNDILSVAGTILQIHTQTNCLIFEDDGLKQNGACTQRFKLINPLGGKYK